MTPIVMKCPTCGKKNRVPAAAPGLPRCGSCHKVLPWIAEAGDGDFANVVESSTIPVVVDLWAPWCGPCRLVSPALESLAREYAGRIKVVKVNVDEAVQTSHRFEVRGIPTLLVMHKGQVVAHQTGAAPERALRHWLDRALSKIDDST
jgi:thioredoxin 2